MDLRQAQDTDIDIARLLLSMGVDHRQSVLILALDNQPSVLGYLSGILAARRDHVSLPSREVK